LSQQLSFLTDVSTVSKDALAVLLLLNELVEEAEKLDRFAICPVISSALRSGGTALLIVSLDLNLHLMIVTNY
jgi:hypothetical protein